jgi:DNA-binding transcriptional LysR family regulator
VNVRVEYRRSNLVYEDILHNSVDFGLVAFPVKMPGRSRSLPFRNDHLVAHHPSQSSPGEARARWWWRDLAGQKFIGFDPDIPTRKAIDQIFRDNKLEMEPVMEFDNIETVKRAVEIDHGIAIVPQATVIAGGRSRARSPVLAVQGPRLLPGRWRNPPPKGPGAHAGDEEVRRNRSASTCLKRGMPDGPPAGGFAFASAKPRICGHGP